MKKLILSLLILLLFPTTAFADPPPKKIYDIPMSGQLQHYTYDLCQSHNLSFELVLGVIHTESRFDPKADSGSSKGLMQLNINTYPALANELNLDHFDPINPVDNITAGVYYLAKLRDTWQGYSDEEVFSLMLISYNRGIQGCKKYVEKYGTENDYVTKVYEYKIMLEQQNIYSQ